MRAKSDPERLALARRMAAGELTRVSTNMFASTEYWQSIQPPERTLHIARTFAVDHPLWTFGGPTAATAHGFETQWRLHTGTVTIITTNRGTTRGFDKVQRVFAQRVQVNVVNGLRVSPPPRTLVDCALTLEFRFALPIFDSAFANGVTADDVIKECTLLNRDIMPVMRLLQHVNPASENGGESLARGTIVDQRFMIPEIQVEFVDPKTRKKYRVDFVWRLPDGRIIVGELDGRAKYTDATMTGGKDVMDVLQEEREREDALKRAGVTTIVRFTYDDVIEIWPFIEKLWKAGVPRDGVSLTM